MMWYGGGSVDFRLRGVVYSLSAVIFSVSKWASLYNCFSFQVRSGFTNVPRETLLGACVLLLCVFDGLIMWWCARVGG